MATPPHASSTFWSTGITQRLCLEGPGGRALDKGALVRVNDMSRKSTCRSLLLAATLLFSLTLSSLAQAQTVSFMTHKDFVSGTNPISVAVGDFNGDGIQDLVLTNYNCCNPFNCCHPNNYTVAVLLGNGDGSFHAARTFAVGIAPWSVAVGDFNGDGKPDLVVANNGSATVSVLLGNGDGTFQAATLYGVGLNPQSVTVGDFNGDGRLDLAVANAGSNTVSVLLGNGNGTFQPARDFVVGSQPWSVVV